MIKANQGFVRLLRLQRAEDFQQTFRLGNKQSQGGLVVYTRLNGLGFARLGLAIAKKIIPSASARNRLKRLIRESFRLNQSRLPEVDIVIVVTNRSLYNNQVLLCDLDKQWSRLEVYYKRA
ncbi:MAG TPA: ribonuclease P protein component [Candidatus Aquirickettsiella sp.]